MYTPQNIYNSHNPATKTQDIYDSFNHFIFSKDRDVFNKLYARVTFYEKTKHLVGDIVECGVFKGSGVMTWLKVLDLNEPNTIKKVIGFDFFNPSFVDTIKEPKDRDAMSQVFSRCPSMNTEFTKDAVYEKLVSAGIPSHKCDLVSGDISLTSEEYISSRPGMRISILYLDLDLYEPTYEALNHLWNRVVDGGIVVFDEHGYHAWSESAAVDRFVSEKGLLLHRTNMKAPTAYIVKGERRNP
jgi:hypothetical protein